ncbi:hypothetical protein O5D80_005263 [Batrachochytrium dendrobatidis]|nr:hypothetical protein O5D80_005263 [Batrachochytrium dendrobatidis]
MEVNRTGLPQSGHRPPRPPHQLAFTFSTSQKSLASSWLTTVRSFYTNILQHIDPTTYTTHVRDVGQYVKPLSETMNDANFSESVNTDSSENLHQAEINENSSPQIHELIETATMHMVVQLIPLLGHFSASVRTGAASLIYELATICDKILLDKDLESILMGLETDDKGYYSYVHELFTLTGASFSIMVLSMVAGLECFRNSSSWHIRGICNAALARLVFENKQSFLNDDLSAIWNLFFSLNSIPQICSIFPDRIIILQALHLLAPIYAVEDTALSCSIIDTLLRLKTKTFSEIEVIKATLGVIFDHICGKHATNSNSSSVVAPALPKKLDRSEFGFDVFQDLISSHDESAYDLLSWAVQEFAVKMSSAQTGIAVVPPIAWSTTINDYIMSLSNHYRASPALVRYGACLSLYSIIKICPSFAKDNKHIWQFIIAGVLDTDYLCAFLYLSMIEMMDLPDAVALRNTILCLRNNNQTNITYDIQYANSLFTDTKKIVKESVLDIVAKYSPPMAPLLLHKLANALDYLPSKEILNQLELIKIWGKKSEKVDTFLIQMITPLCASSNESIQLKALEVLHAITPALLATSQADISFVWAYIVALMSPALGSVILKSVLNLIEFFPLIQLNTVAREELMSCLFKLIFYNDPDVRMEVYTIIGGAAEFWKISGQMNMALALLFLAIGDDNTKCAQTVISKIHQLGNQSLVQIQSQLNQMNESLQGTLQIKIRAYDQLATSLAIHKTDYRSLIDAMLLHERIDEFWQYYLADVPENQLARPDDYNYSRNMIQSPFWVSLLFTKLSCAPPLLSTSLGSRRDIIPTTPAGKRRFFCGYMACLLPSVGIPDFINRRAACVCVVRCCFKGLNVNPGMLRGLLEYATQQMFSHKHWSFQVSALEILGLIIRLKIPGVSESILYQYLDLCIDFAHNTPSAVIKTALLNFFEILLMVFPKAMISKLQEVRDITRVMLVDSDTSVIEAASRIYPLIFRAVPKESAQQFYEYLMNDISTITSGGLELAGDPLVSKLTTNEASRIVSLSISCIGVIDEGFGSHYAVAQELIKFVIHNNSDYRVAALTAILSLIHGMDQQESLSITWIILPLYADPCRHVRFLFVRFLRNLPNLVESRCQGLLPHANDSTVPPLVSWEEILTDTATLVVGSKFLQDMLFDIDALNPHSLSQDLPVEDDGFNFPTVSSKLMTRYKVLVQATTSPILAKHQSEVIYFLQEIQKQPLLQASAIMVLSEFSCLHDNTLNEIGDLLTGGLSQHVTPENKPVIEACILALSNISNNSTYAFKILFGKMLTPAVPNEGDLLGFLYLVELIKVSAFNRVPELLNKIVPIISNSRASLKKRLYAVFLAVDLCVVGGQESTKTVLDAVGAFSDSLDNNMAQLQIHQTTSRILAETGPKHPFFRNMFSRAKQDVKSKHVWRRLQALSVFRLFAPHISTEDCMWFVFHFLADPSANVRKASHEAIALGRMIEFAYAILQRNSANVKENALKSELLATCKLSTLNSTPEAPSANATPIIEREAVRIESDPFNSKYYGSERRMRFSKMYGLNESQMVKMSTAASQGVISSIEARVLNTAVTSPETLLKLQWLLKLDPILILHDLIGLHSNIATDIVESLLADIEKGSKFRLALSSGELTDSEPFESLATSTASAEDDTDIEVATHRIDVLSNLLIAYEGVGTKYLEWIKRFQETLMFCNECADSLRETLYMDVERSKYFYNEYADIPIVSDEQFDSIEQYRAAAQEATLDIIKSGKIDKMSGIESKRSEMNESMDTKSEQLRKVTKITLHLLSGCGLFYALSTSTQSNMLIEGFEFISTFLSNEHRGIRSTAVEALRVILELQLDIPSNFSLVEKVHDVMSRLFAELNNRYQMLYRRKADYAILISQMVVHITNPQYRFDILRVLVRMWRDPDSEVRVTSIQMVKLLGQAKLPEVLVCFADPSTSNKEKAQVPIMEELASLVSNEDYGERDILQDLLKWRFSLSPTNMAAIESR